jgi:hypothetical protein
MVKALFASFAATVLLLTPTMAFADDAPPPLPTTTPAPAPAPPPAPQSTKVHHAPPSSVRVGEALEIRAEIDRPDLVKRVLVVYRSGKELREVAFQRAASAGYVATLPSEEVKPPEIAYAIEIEDKQGARTAAFATREDLHPVRVMDEVGDLREETQLQRIGRRRSVLGVSTEYVYFGTSTANVMVAGAAAPQTIRDEYWRVDASYTYRVLRTLSEFGIRFGVVRGSSVVPGGGDPNVGLNYGAPRIRIRATDWLHFDAEALASVTEVGFSVGGGGAVLFGDLYGAKLTMGFEAIQVFGVRGYTRLDIPAGSRVILTPMVEVTNMPHASDAGVRLLLDAGFNLGKGFSIVLRGGYMARSWTDAGFGGGLSTNLAF